MNKLLLLLIALTCIAPVRLHALTNAIPAGSKLFACFVGRTPCHEIARELGAPVRDECHKLKWEIFLYQDETTGAPTTYLIASTFYRQSPRTGKWKSATRATPHRNATIYELEPASGHAAIRLLKADDNVLFFVGQHGSPLVGNADFSYTLNRASENTSGNDNRLLRLAN